MSKIYTIDEIKQIVTPIAKSYGAKEVYLFGSYARGDATEKSDIDLRVTKGGNIIGIELGGLYADLEDALKKEIDLVTTESLFQKSNKDFVKRLIKSMKRDEKVIYEQ